MDAPTPAMPENQALSFFERLYKNKPNDLYILIWELPGRKSVWHTDLARATTYAETLGIWHNVYFGVGLSSRDYGPDHRVIATDIAGIPGLWVDIDVAGPAHTKPNLPPTREDALSLLTDLPLMPNMIVDSGSGFHAYWVFAEPWIFEDEDEQMAAATLVRRWQGTIRTAAQRKGWIIDATHDLPRVLRVPGTSNLKHNPPHHVTIEMMLDLSYELTDFDEYLAEDSGSTTPVDTSRVQVGAPTDDAAPPLEKWVALMENDKTFKQTFEHTRKDTAKWKGTSLSEWDISLAYQAARVEWTDQEIQDLLIYHRRKHGGDLKLSRRDSYYARTIAFAHRVLSERGEEVEAVSLSEDPGEEEIFSRFARMRINIIRVLRYPGRWDGKEIGEDLYEIETNRGIIQGDIDLLMDGAKFSRAIFSQIGILIPPKKKSEWLPYAQVLRSAAVDMEPDENLSDPGRLAIYLRDYFSMSEARSVEPTDEMIEERWPWTNSHYSYFYSDKLREFLAVRHWTISSIALGRLLRNIKAEPHFFRHGDATIRCWKVKASIIGV